MSNDNKYGNIFKEKFKASVDVFKLVHNYIWKPDFYRYGWGAFSIERMEGYIIINSEGIYYRSERGVTGFEICLLNHTHNDYDDCYNTIIDNYLKYIVNYDLYN